MNGHLLRGLLALYPRTFRDRYGAELARLTDELINAGEITPLLTVLNLAGGAALEWGRVLTGSRRAALAVSAAAVMAAAGSLVIAAGQGSVQVIVGSPASKPGQVAAAVAPVVVLLPGTLSIQTGSSPGQVPVSIRIGSAGPCVIKLPPPAMPAVPKG
jgi:hypothetical protein